MQINFEIKSRKSTSQDVIKLGHEMSHNLWMFGLYTVFILVGYIVLWSTTYQILHSKDVKVALRNYALQLRNKKDAKRSDLLKMLSIE